MKKFMSVLIISLLIITARVHAAGSFSVTLSNKQVEPNGKFNITLTGNSVGRVDIKVDNGKCSSLSLWYEEKAQTISCSAGNIGVVKITITPQKGFSDSDGNLYSPGVKTLSVEIKKNVIAASSTTKSTTKTTTTKRQENSTIKTTTNTKTTSKNITTKNESATTKMTTSTVEDNKKAILTYDNEEIHLSRKQIEPSLAPVGFSISDIEIDNTNYQAFKIKDNYLLKSEYDDIYYVYDSNSSTFVNKVTLLTTNNKKYFIDNNIDNATSLTVGNNTIMGEKLADNYYKIKVLNKSGDIIYYTYETSEGSMQLFSEELFACKTPETVNIKNGVSWYVIGFGFILFIMGLLIFTYFKLWRK